MMIPPRHAERTYAQEMVLRAEAESEHEAELAIKDLRETGFALMKNGKRYVPPAPTPPTIVFSELLSRAWDEAPK